MSEICSEGLINVQDAYNLLERLGIYGNFYNMRGLTCMPVSFTEARFEINQMSLPCNIKKFLKEWDAEMTDLCQEASARSTALTTGSDSMAAGDQACSSDKVNTRSSQFISALKRLNDTVTEENIEALKKMGKMQLSDDEILVGIGIHLIKSLTGNAETTLRRSLMSCPCGCQGKLDSSATMYIGSEDTLHGELDIISHGVGLTAVDKIPIESEFADSGVSKAKLARQSSNGQRANLESKKLVIKEGTSVHQQVVSQAITFGWTQYNRHKEPSPYIPSLLIDGSLFGLYLYNPEKDSLFIGEDPISFLYDSRDIKEKCSGIFAIWLILHHRLFFKKNVVADKYESNFKEHVNIDFYYKLKDYSVFVKHHTKTVQWGRAKPAITI